VESSSSEEDSGDDSSSDDLPPAKAQTPSAPKPAAVAAAAPASAPPAARAQGVPFKRVDVDAWTGKLPGIGVDNSYAGTFGAAGYGAKAQEKLGVTRGKGFTKEKNKARRPHRRHDRGHSRPPPRRRPSAAHTAGASLTRGRLSPLRCALRRRGC
jgi:hypothetical protein